MCHKYHIIIGFQFLQKKFVSYWILIKYLIMLPGHMNELMNEALFNLLVIMYNNDILFNFIICKIELRRPCSIKSFYVPPPNWGGWYVSCSHFVTIFLCATGTILLLLFILYDITRTQRNLHIKQFRWLQLKVYFVSRIFFWPIWKTCIA